MLFRILNICCTFTLVLSEIRVQCPICLFIIIIIIIITSFVYLFLLILDILCQFCNWPCAGSVLCILVPIKFRGHGKWDLVTTTWRLL